MRSEGWKTVLFSNRRARSPGGGGIGERLVLSSERRQTCGTSCEWTQHGRENDEKDSLAWMGLFAKARRAQGQGQGQGRGICCFHCGAYLMMLAGDRDGTPLY